MAKHLTHMRSDWIRHQKTRKTSKFQFGWKEPLVAIFNQLSCCQKFWMSAITTIHKNGYQDDQYHESWSKMVTKGPLHQNSNFMYSDVWFNLTSCEFNLNQWVAKVKFFTLDIWICVDGTDIWIVCWTHSFCILSFHQKI